MFNDSIRLYNELHEFVLKTMSKDIEDRLKNGVCKSGGCWTKRKLVDAGVVADLRGPWHILRLDNHFAACVDEAKRIGGLCDGVAVLPQDNNNSLRVFEVKASLEDLPKAKAQLKKGAELVAEKIQGGFTGMRVTLEIHVGRAPKNTMKLQQSVSVNGTKFAVEAFKNGIKA